MTMPNLIRIKPEKREHYEIVCTKNVQCESISWAAKGLYLYLVTRKKDWVIRMADLLKRSTDGRHTIKRCVKELKDAGFLETKRVRGEHGAFSGWDWVVYDNPIENNASTERPKSGSRLSAERSKNGQWRKPIVEKTDSGEIGLLNKSTDIDNKSTKEDNRSTDTEKDIAPDGAPYAEIINHLNSRAGTSYHPATRKNQALIDARLKEGFTVDDFKTVIDKKAAEWLGTEWEQYLRPFTLFGSKFEGYLNQPAKRKQMSAAQQALANEIAAGKIKLEDILT